MKRWLAKLLINRSVDSGNKLPAWVDRLIVSDQSLRAHFESMQAMVDQLRTDSKIFFEPNSQPARPPATIAKSRKKGFAVTIAIAAVMLLAAVLWKIRPGTISDDSTIVKRMPAATDIELVEVAIAQPRKLADRLVASASSLAQRTPKMSRPNVADFTTKPIQQAGRKFGRILAVLAQSSE